MEGEKIIEKKYQGKVKSDGGEKEGRDRPGKDEATSSAQLYQERGGEDRVNS